MGVTLAQRVSILRRTAGNRIFLYDHRGGCPTSGGQKGGWGASTFRKALAAKPANSQTRRWSCWSCRNPTALMAQPKWKKRSLSKAPPAPHSLRPLLGGTTLIGGQATSSAQVKHAHARPHHTHTHTHTHAHAHVHNHTHRHTRATYTRSTHTKRLWLFLFEY